MEELWIYFAIATLVMFIIAELFLLSVVCKYGGGNTINTVPPEKIDKDKENPIKR